MSRLSLRVSGMEELLQRMHAAPPKVQKSVARKALPKAATVVARQARVNARAGRLSKKRGQTSGKTPRRPLHTAQGLIVRARGKRSHTYPSGTVFTAVGYAYPTHSHGHFVELGTTRRKKKSTGQNTGVMPASPYLQRAARQRRTQALRTLRMGMDEALRKAFKR